MDVETLVRMGRQIARNNAALPAERAVARVAGHLRSFWAPSMIAQLSDYAVGHPEQLDATLVAALRTLAAEAAQTAAPGSEGTALTGM